MKGLVNSVAYENGLRVGEVAIQDISEVLKQPGRFVWVGLHEPDDELLSEIQKEFSLHDLAVEDAARAHQRPKLERYGDSIFIVLRTAHADATTGEIDYGETHLFVGANYIVSVRHGPSLPYVEVRSRCESTPDLLVKGPGFVLYALMDFIVDQYFPLIETFEDKLEALEDNIFRQARIAGDDRAHLSAQAGSARGEAGGRPAGRHLQPARARRRHRDPRRRARLFPRRL